MTNDSSPPFIHLRVKSAYSLAEGAIRVKDLVKLSAGLDMPAVALTDRGNLFGALEFAVTASKAGLQPVIGAVLGILRGKDERGSSIADPDHLLLLAQDKTGYENLMSLISEGYLLADGGDPAVAFDALAQARGAVGGRQFRDESAFRTDRHDNGVLDALRFHESEDFRAEILRAIGPAQAAARDLAATQMYAFDRGRVDENLERGFRLGQTRHEFRQKLQR